MSTATLTCPKCVGEMQTIDRSGIHVERCKTCGGIFLDHGELERLMGAERSYYRRDDDDDDDWDDDDRWRGGLPWQRDREERPGEYGRKKKRRGFLDDFLDFG
jgi:hypothetical protein